MDSPGSDDERLRQAAAGEAMITKKMKILIIMLSLVLIILLLPLASNHGLPLLRPMGISMLQRLWDAMRFIAMTAAISIGIISTSNSQKNNKGFDGSSRHRSSSSIRRPSAPLNASGDRESINPNLINGIQSAPYYTQWQNFASGEPPGGRGEETGDPQKLKGKEVMNDLAFAASTSDTSFDSSREGEFFELETSPSRQSTQSPHLAPHDQYGEDHENLKQRLAKNNITNSRRRLSAGDIWFVPPRIDEEEEEYISASARHGDVSSTSRSRGESYIRKVNQLQKKASSMVDEEEKKEINTSADRRSMNVGTTSMTDEYAELRMRRSAISRLAGDHVNGKAERRSSSVDRRRPIKYDYDKESPDQPGLKQILMDLSEEKAYKGKLRSNLSSGSEAHNNVANQRPVDVREESNRTQADHTKMGSSQIVQKQVDAKVGTVQIVQNQGTHHHAKNIAASHQAPQKLVDDAKISGSSQTLQKDNARMLLGSDQISQRHPGPSSVLVSVQMQRRRNDTKGSAHIVQTSNQHQEEDPHPARSKLLMQSSKHSRSAVNLEQLEQIGNSSSVHSTRPTSRSSARKKSFSYDFGDGFSPDWLLELEPPPPPGFFDQHSTDMMSSSPPEAAQSDYPSKPPNPGFKNIASPAPVQSLVPWRSSNPIDISAYPRAASPLSPPDTSSAHSTTGPSPGEVNRRAEEFISNFNTRLIRQRQESLERQRRYGRV